MHPLFEERRRPINLGGHSSSTSQVSILNEAKAKREARQNNKRRLQNAVRIQAWWRGMREAKVVRQELRRAFEQDITGVTGLRCLVLIGQDERALGMWSNAMVSSGEESLLAPGAGQNRTSWFVLIKQLSIRLLRSVADDPQSQNAVAHLQILNLLLSSPVLTRILGSAGSELSTAMTRHLLSNQMHKYIGQAITRIPVEKKNAPALPLLVALITVPLPAFSSDSIEFIFTHILTIPLLPNRLPLASLGELSARLPLSFMQNLSPFDFVSTLSTDSKVHLISNLMAFTPPRYNKISASAVDAYLSLLTTIMNSLPVNALEPPSVSSSKSWSNDVESDDDTTLVQVVTSFSKPEPLPQLDSKTLKRLQTLPSPSHLHSLLAAHPRIKEHLFAFILSLCTVWPGRKDKVLSSVVIHTGGNIIRELYRGYVRGSPLGRDDQPTALMDSANASHWPPLLLLTDLYAQALLTMGDDEFFASVTTANVNRDAPRNPLSLDELTSFSRKLLNIAFTLYWKEDQTNVAEGKVPGLGMQWIVVREKVTRCLQDIHARDSRRTFTPPDHWLVTSQIDVQSFVEAAIFEERQISQNGEEITLPSSTMGMSRMSNSSRALSKRQVAYLSPRLGVLHNVPFSIPFEVRVSIYRNFVANDMMSRGGVDRFSRRGRTRIVVRRDKIAQDGFDKLQEVDLKSSLEIVFIDQFGNEEAGIDGGGVFKEFLTSLAKEVFDSDRGLWLSTEQNELYPNPHSYAKDSYSLSWYRFIGRILGKALYEGILVDVAFAGFFLAKWLGKQSFLDDLASLDPELYQGLLFLKHYSGNHEDLALNFTVTQEEFGVPKSIELVPNGSNIPITKENKLQYIYLVSHFKLTKQIKLQSEAFFEGLSDMIDPKWLKMFNQQELQILLGGVNAPIDLVDLRKHTNYGGLYDDEQETIEMFWKVAETFDHDQRRALLRFATSCSRPPLLGFKELVPNFAIRDAGSDNERLPTASTCVNLLKLPRYTNAKVLRAKLLQAINSGAGFDLS